MLPIAKIVKLQIENRDTVNRTIIVILVCFLILQMGCEKRETLTPAQPTKNSGPKGEFTNDWTYSIGPYRNFDRAEFRLWVPDSISDIRAILVLSNSYNGSALAFTGKEYWQDYARKERLALLGTHYKSFSGMQKDYADATGGSGLALLTALDTIAKKHNLNELGELPLLLRGYSAGGVFSYFFSDYKPERVLAFANMRGGSAQITPSSNTRIPGMFMIGENDHPSRVSQMKQLVLYKRNKGARWSFAIEPGTDHYGKQHNSDELIKKFFSKVLAERIVDGSNELRTIPENSGWLGNNDTQEVAGFDAYTGEKNDASWLIDESLALAWRAYQ